MKRSIILIIFVLLVAAAYVAGIGTTAIKGKTQACNSTLIIHSAPNTNELFMLAPTSQVFQTDSRGNYTFTHLCAGHYTVCVERTRHTLN